MQNPETLYSIARFIAREKAGELNSTETDQLNQWLQESDKNQQVYKKFKDGGSLVKDLIELEKYNSRRAYQKVIKNINDREGKRSSLRMVPGYLKYAAAIILIAASSYLAYRITQKPEIIPLAELSIEPGKKQAVLITSDQKRIPLESSDSEELIDGEPAEIIREGAILKYEKTEAQMDRNAGIVYNILETPPGSEYSLILSDGSEIMLNAGSRLKYPVVFLGETREVELEGEAYFKVAASKTSQFIVRTSNMLVKAYGTVFNVSAYQDQHIKQTTLVEGSVGISLENNHDPSEIRIVPGQQFSYDREIKRPEVKEVNIEQFIAWTKGMFVFENAPVENILTSMARWYDFGFEFENEDLKDQRFTLSLDRYENAEKILEMISATSDLEFEFRAGKLLVRTKNITYNQP